MRQVWEHLCLPPAGRRAAALFHPLEGGRSLSSTRWKMLQMAPDGSRDGSRWPRMTPEAAVGRPSRSKFCLPPGGRRAAALFHPLEGGRSLSSTRWKMLQMAPDASRDGSRWPRMTPQAAVGRPSRSKFCLPSLFHPVEDSSRWFQMTPEMTPEVTPPSMLCRIAFTHSVFGRSQNIGREIPSGSMLQ